MGAPWGNRRRLAESDALLLHAHAVMKATTCAECGRGVEECRDRSVEWTVLDDEVCGPSAALEKYRKDRNERDDPGVMLRVVRRVEGQSVSSQAALLAAQREVSARGS